MNTHRLTATVPCLFLILPVIGIAQTSQRRPEPVKFTPDTVQVYLKAQMSPARPNLEKRFIQRCHLGDYVNRRFTAQGITAKGLVQAAFRTTADRLLDSAGLSDQLFSVEVIVPKGREAMLVPMVKQTILCGLGVTASWETVNMPVGVLRRDETKPLGLRKSQSKKGMFLPGKSRIKGVGQSVEMLARLIATSSFGMPVVNETDLDGTYDFDFECREGDLPSLQEVLSNVGLNLLVEKRSLEMVVIRPAAMSGGQ